MPVEELEYLGEHIADVGEEEQHNWDAYDGVHYRNDLAEVRLARRVAVACDLKYCIREKKGEHLW